MAFGNKMPCIPEHHQIPPVKSQTGRHKADIHAWTEIRISKLETNSNIELERLETNEAIEF
jgi:hypothetical protein